MRTFPAWTDADGYPLSWRHYVTGLRHLARHAARERLKIAAAVRAAESDRRGYENFRRDLERVAE